MNDVVEELEVEIKKIRYKGIVFVPEQKKTNSNKSKNVKKPYIVKWVEKKSVGDVFTKDQFYKLYPKLKKDAVGRRRVDEAIQDMILDGRIEQYEILGQYKVVK